MTGTPAFSVGLGRSRAARASVVVLLSLSVSGLIAWRMPASLVTPTLLVGMLVAVSVTLTVIAAMWPSVAQRLRWDGRQWHIGPLDQSTDDDRPAEIEVMFDVGALMLLRARVEPVSGRGRLAWLPVQRSSVDGSWHALRCALYSPRPATGGAAADEPAFPSA